jgi:multidrug resistance efflux pump
MAQSQADTSAGAQSHETVCHAKAMAELLERDDPSDRFLDELLATQCRLAKADAGAILRLADAAKIEILAAFPRPNGNGALAWTNKADKSLPKALQEGKSVIVQEPADSQIEGTPRHYQILIPLQNRSAVRAAAVYRLKARTPQRLLLSQARLETTSLLLNHHELRLAMRLQHDIVDRLRCVLEVLDVFNRPKRFLGAAMALCNEMAARLGCQRVSLGLLKGRSVQVRAMSHADTFSRKMQAVQAIEAAMEECFDQDLEVIHPAVESAVYASRASARLAEQHGPASIASLPLREDGDVKGVITLERAPERPFDSLAEIEIARLICDLCAPRLLDLQGSDRWLGTRAVSDVRKYAGAFLGPEHTWIKLAAGVVFLAVLLLATLKGDYRIKAPFTFEARHRMAVVTPFDTFAKEIVVEPGDRVDGGQTLLGSLETSELRLKLAALKAEQLGYRKQMAAAMRDRNTAEAQIAEAQSDKAAAEIRLIEKKIEQATLVAPISGWVVSEDLKQQIGAPVETGEILFEIASIDALRAELYVPENAIARVMPEQRGELAAVGHPDQRVGFTVERINPIAEVIDQQNVFRVRARLSEHRDWMRPGMKGEGRIFAGKKSYLWIFSHHLVDWLRMKLWV